MTDFLREQALENLKKYFKGGHCEPLHTEDDIRSTFPKFTCARCGETVSVFYWPLTMGANEVHVCDRCFKSFREWWDTPHKDVTE